MEGLAGGGHAARPAVAPLGAASNDSLRSLTNGPGAELLTSIRYGLDVLGSRSDFLRFGACYPPLDVDPDVSPRMPRSRVIVKGGSGPGALVEDERGSARSNTSQCLLSFSTVYLPFLKEPFQSDPLPFSPKHRAHGTKLRAASLIPCKSMFRQAMLLS